MKRLSRVFRRRRYRLAAWVITAFSLAALGYGIFVAHAWQSCRSSDVKSYPNAYPQCRGAGETHRPELMAAAGGLFLVFGVGSIYLWTDERTRAEASAASARVRRR